MSQPSPSTFGPTQKDIAEALELSQSTVALALSGKQQHRLLPETVALIQAKARELGYHPQRYARILREGRSHTLGVVFRSSPHHAPQERVTYLGQSALKSGYQLIAVDEEWFGAQVNVPEPEVPETPDSSKDEEEIEESELNVPEAEPSADVSVSSEESEAIKAPIPPGLEAAQNYLLDAAVEGVILCNLAADAMKAWAEFLKSRSLPYVFLSNYPPTTSSRESTIQADLATAFREMTEHHLSLGSRHLILLLGYYTPRAKRAKRVVAQRVGGFTDAIRAAGGQAYTSPSNGKWMDLPTRIPRRTPPPIVGEVLYCEKREAFNNPFELGDYQMTQFIQTGKIPDSIICSNDEIALGVLGACIRHGVSVPRTVRISGADNAPFGRYCGIPITTIQQPSQQMAERSTKRLIELVEAQAKGKAALAAIEVTQPVRLPCEIIIRASTEAAPSETVIEEALDDIW